MSSREPTPLDKLRSAAQRAQDVNDHVSETAERIRAEREQAEEQPAGSEHANVKL